MIIQVEESSKPASWWAKGSRPIWLVASFWIATLLALPLVLHWLNANDIYNDTVVFGLIGFSGIVVGQLCVIALASGLRWRTWAEGYMLGLAITSFGVLTVAFGYWLAGDHDNGVFLPLAAFPAFLLSLASPLIAVRHLSGWRLVARNELAPPRDSFRLADLFAYTAIVAASLVVLRIPQVTTEENVEEFWIPMLIVCGAAFAIGLFVLPVCVRFALGTSSRLVAVAGLMLLAILVPTVISGITLLAIFRDSDWSERVDALKPILAVCGGATISLYASLIVLGRCGMSLVKTNRNEPVAGERKKSSRTSTRWLTASSIVIAILVSICVSKVEQRRRATEAEIERLDAIATGLNGEIGSRDRTITAIQLGQRATDSDLDQFLHCTDLDSIDLSHSAVTDLGVAKLKHFPKITSLTLNDTQVTDQGLAALSELQDLDWLELKDTKVDGSGFEAINTNSKLFYLELDNAPFDDAGCRVLRRFPNIAHLSLAGTRVTNIGLQHLSELGKLSSLNVAGTAVTGDGLSKLTQVTRLVLDGTEIDDASVSDIMALTQLWTLDLSTTAITDTTLHQLRSLSSLHHLTLTQTAVTGEGFRDWSGFSELETLALSRTALTDSHVKYLQYLSPLTVLDLSETSITDACLADLANMQIESLDISQTKVTAAGLLGAGLTNVNKLHIASNQGSDADKRKLDARFELLITVVPDGENQSE